MKFYLSLPKSFLFGMRTQGHLKLTNARLQNRRLPGLNDGAVGEGVRVAAALEAEAVGTPVLGRLRPEPHPAAARDGRWSRWARQNWSTSLYFVILLAFCRKSNADNYKLIRERLLHLVKFLLYLTFT